MSRKKTLTDDELFAKIEQLRIERDAYRDKRMREQRLKRHETGEQTKINMSEDEVTLRRLLRTYETRYYSRKLRSQMEKKDKSCKI